MAGSARRGSEDDEDGSKGPSSDTIPMTAVVHTELTPTPRSSYSTTPVTGATQRRRAIEERMDALVGREHRAKFRTRMLFTLRVALVVWVGFGVPMDLIAASQGSPFLLELLLVRLLPVVVGFGAYQLLRWRTEPRTLFLRAYETVMVSLAVGFACMTYIFEGGWESPRIPAVILIIMGHSVMLGSKWQRSVIPVMTMIVSLPAYLALYSLFSPEMMSQLHDSEAMRSFVVPYATICAAGAISLVAGHITWKLRAEVAEARSIGRYQLRKRIASGGMGEVWAAFHAGLQRDVAVKIIQPRLGRDPVAVERFEREVRMLAELTHPNTVRIFDYGATDAGVWYYAMELLDADDLQSRIDQWGPVHPQTALRFVTQASDALAEVHQRGMIHRDIKPSNLLVVKAGGMREYVKLIDFGIARFDEEEQGLTQTGMVLGTPGYIAPEVVTGGRSTTRSDVYSLGMVFYVLVTGELPFRGNSPDIVARKSIYEDIPPPSSVRPAVSPAIDHVIMRCLERDPADRYSSAVELSEALRTASEVPPQL